MAPGGCCLSSDPLGPKKPRQSRESPEKPEGGQLAGREWTEREEPAVTQQGRIKISQPRER